MKCAAKASSKFEMAGLHTYHLSLREEMILIQAQPCAQARQKSSVIQHTRGYRYIGTPLWRLNVPTLGRNFGQGLLAPTSVGSVMSVGRYISPSAERVDQPKG